MRIEPGPPVQQHELCQQGHSLRAVFSESLRQRGWSRSRYQPLGTRKLLPAWHGLFRRRSNQIKNDIQLMVVALTGQDRLSCQHFTKDTSDKQKGVSISSTRDS